MDPTFLRVIGPGFLNQVPTLVWGDFRTQTMNMVHVSRLRRPAT